MLKHFAFAVTFFCVANATMAETLNVAVASSFRPVMEILAKDFENQTGHHLSIRSASSGVLYQQLVFGAQVDVFLSADERFPRLVTERGLAKPFTLTTYALGQLVIAGERIDNIPQRLSAASPRSVAIPKPNTAPYGAAAKQVYEYLNLWSTARESRVEASNVAQSQLLLVSGQVPLAFTAQSLLDENRAHTLVPPEWYAPIKHQLVVLEGANAAARAFVDFMVSDSARAHIADAGFKLP